MMLELLQTGPEFFKHSVEMSAIGMTDILRQSACRCIDVLYIR